MSAESRLVGAALTALLHLLVLWGLLRVPAGSDTPPRPPALQAASAEQLRDAGEQLVEVDIRPQLATRRGRACTGSSYVGVGITADPRTDRIILVGENTPASRAGLRHDDIVLNPSVWQQAHAEGALLLVLVLREGGQVTLPVLVGRICIEQGTRGSLRLLRVPCASPTPTGCQSKPALGSRRGRAAQSRYSVTPLFTPDWLQSFELSREWPSPSRSNTVQIE